MRCKKMLIIIFIFLILICGCSKKTKKDVSIKDGKIKVVCSSGNLGDSVIITKSKITANYNSDRKIINYKVETTEKNTDKKIFKDRKKMYDDTYKNIKDNNAVYDYSVNEGTMTFTIISVYKEMDLKALGEEERNKYELNNFVRFYEDNSYKCKVSGISKKELKK